jgi:regulatory protein
MRIIDIESLSARSERVRLRLEDGRTEEIAGEILYRAGLRAGQEIDEAELRRLLGQDEAWRAREAALRLLSYRPRTELELRRRLQRQGFPSEVAEWCVEELSARGLVDDAGFAESFTRDRVRLNPRGRRRVVQELRGKGVDAETAAAAVDEVLRTEEVEELDLARDAARRWRARPGEETARARRRLTGFLARRGFGGETVLRVVDELCPEP